jgi:predicted alpha-1,6-mannanase (GH76 family)
VADNWNNGRSDGGALTYNQGTFLGGCHWLYKLTGNQDYLDDAVTTTNYTIERMQAAGEGGVMILNSESGATEGNNSMFRAIFLRYFVDIINESDVDVATRTVWYDNLKGWADYVWTDGKGIDKGTGITDPGEMLFGYDWKKLLTQDEIEAGVNLGNQASGAVLIEAMNIAKNPDSEDN